MVMPIVENVNDFNRIQRKVIMKPISVKDEKRVINNIISIAKEMLSRYPTTIEVIYLFLSFSPSLFLSPSALLLHFSVSTPHPRSSPSLLFSFFPCNTVGEGQSE